jgi:hypothetical protein
VGSSSVGYPSINHSVIVVIATTGVVETVVAKATVETLKLSVRIILAIKRTTYTKELLFGAYISSTIVRRVKFEHYAFVILPHYIRVIDTSHSFSPF